jgi:hypothetical protein
MKLRPELLLYDASDGGLDVLDLVLEQEHHFDAAEARDLRREPIPERLGERLARALLLEGPSAEALRRGCRNGRTRAPAPAPGFAAARGPWSEAARLPAMVAPAWREGERWRRLAEDRIAGRALLRLDGFLAGPAADALRAAAAALPFARHETLYVRGEGLDLHAELDELVAPFRDGPLHALLAAVMGEPLPSRIFARVWRLGPGDHIAVHRDGLHYVTTFSLGLSTGWTAASGGALAFGHPVERGLEIVERWLPHLGDLLVFRPTALAWHAVEPVAHGTRLTLTGHYVAASYPG